MDWCPHTVEHPGGVLLLGVTFGGGNDTRVARRAGAGPRVERGVRREIVREVAFVGLTYVASLAIAGFGGETRRAYASQVGLSANALASAVAETSGRRATKVDPDGPLSSTVSVP